MHPSHNDTDTHGERPKTDASTHCRLLCVQKRPRLTDAWMDDDETLVEGVPVDRAYRSAVPVPARHERHERFSDWEARAALMLRAALADETLAAGSVLLVTHGYTAACLAWMLAAAHPPLLGYCALTSCTASALAASALTTTHHLVPALPFAGIGDAHTGAGTSAGVQGTQGTQGTLWGRASLGTTTGLPGAFPGCSSASDNVLVWLAVGEGLECDRSGRVTHWADAAAGLPGHTGAPRHAAQCRTAFRPRAAPAPLLRRIPVVSFDNGTTATGTATGTVTGPTGTATGTLGDRHLVATVTGSHRSFTVAVLFRAATLADIHTLLTTDPAHETHGLDVRVDRAGNLGVFAGSTVAVVARRAVAPERWTLLVVRVRNGREVRLWLDASRVVVGGALRGLCPAFGPWEGLHLARSTPATHAFHGDIAEVVAFAAALDDTAIDQLHSYFVSKFA